MIYFYEYTEANADHDEGNNYYQSINKNIKPPLSIDKFLSILVNIVHLANTELTFKLNDLPLNELFGKQSWQYKHKQCVVYARRQFEPEKVVLIAILFIFWSRLCDTDREQSGI